MTNSLCQDLPSWFLKSSRIYLSRLESVGNQFRLQIQADSQGSAKPTE